MSSEKQTLYSATKRCYSQIGWATFTLCVTTVTFSVFLLVLSFLPSYDTHIGPFIEKYLLLFNEAFIALAVLIGGILLFDMPTAAPPHGRVGAKLFFAVFCICFTVSTVGSQLGNLWGSLWDGLLGNDHTDALTEMLLGVSPWQMILCVGILAPILEELFFRKLLIDRLYGHGELFAILSSGLLFGLFHTNISQFFYTLGIGIALAYLYCKTRSFLAVTLLHALFNLIGGILPSLALPELYSFFEALERLETPATETVLSLLREYALPLIYYLFHLLLQGGLTLAGVLILLFNFKKIRLTPTNALLSSEERLKAVFLNGGMLTAIGVLSLQTIASIFGL